MSIPRCVYPTPSLPFSHPLWAGLNSPPPVNHNHYLCSNISSLLFLPTSSLPPSLLPPSSPTTKSPTVRRYGRFREARSRRLIQRSQVQFRFPGHKVQGLAGPADLYNLSYSTCTRPSIGSLPLPPHRAYAHPYPSSISHRPYHQFDAAHTVGKSTPQNTQPIHHPPNSGPLRISQSFFLQYLVVGFFLPPGSPSFSAHCVSVSPSGIGNEETKEKTQDISRLDPARRH